MISTIYRAAAIAGLGFGLALPLQAQPVGQQAPARPAVRTQPIVVQTRPVNQLNPQPLPPVERERGAVALNPQPLPPVDIYGQPVNQLNPQPLPPVEIDAARPAVQTAPPRPPRRNRGRG